MQRSLLSSVAVVAAATLVISPLRAQQPAPLVRMAELLPADVSPDEVVFTPDGRRAYYTTSDSPSAPRIVMWDAERKTSATITTASVWSLTLSPKGDVLAYTKRGENPSDFHVWTMPLDARSGLPSGPERRVSLMQGDPSSISPDGKLLAFARRDSPGGESLVVLPIEGGPETVAVKGITTGITLIRWTPDGRTIYFTVERASPTGQDSILKVPARGGPPTTVVRSWSGTPGLSPDGRWLVYGDTAPGRYVISDTAGRRLTSFELPVAAGQLRWLSAATLAVVTPTSVGRVRSFSIAGGGSGIVVDSLYFPWAEDPQWSPDGKLFPVVTGRAFSRKELRIFRAGGSLVKILPMTETSSGGMRWSPDQQWISYSGSASTSPRHLNVLNVVTGREIPLIAIDPWLDGTIWRGDSKALLISQPEGVASRSPGASTVQRSIIKEVDLTGRARVLHDFSLGGSPHGAYLVDTGTVLLKRAGEPDYQYASLRRPFAEQPFYRPGEGHVSAPAFSRDGKLVVFRRNPNGDDAQAFSVIDLMPRDGSGKRTVKLPFLAAPRSPNPFVLPGGEQLVVMERPAVGDPGVYLIDVATANVKKLFTTPRAGSRYNLISMSPDGRTILYLTLDRVPPATFSVDVARMARSGGR